VECQSVPTAAQPSDPEENYVLSLVWDVYPYPPS
jgi:hypothetical protein